jgi:ribulose-phosphate 3-epimerase
MNPVIPTVFAQSKEEFTSRLQKILSISNNIQIDFMDGKFVKARSLSLSDLPPLSYPNKNFEAHLMVKDPMAWVPKLKSQGFEKIIFHIEAMKDDDETEEMLQLLKQENILSFIAVNPKTPVEKVFPFLSRVKGILLMGVEPGKENQAFINSVYAKIKLLRSVNKAIKIQIDGGANDKTVKKMIEAGANYVNSGSFVSEAKNPRAAYQLLVSLAKKAK